MSQDQAKESRPRSRKKGGLRLPRHTWRWLVFLCLSAVTAYLVLPRSRPPVSLLYEVSLAAANQGQLTVYLTVHGRLPGALRLSLPAGPNTAEKTAVEVTGLRAFHLRRDGRPGREFPCQRTEESWSLRPRSLRPARIVYQIALPVTQHLQTDIRQHLSAAGPWGFRAAGYHVFLVPENVAVDATRVRFRQAAGGALAVPWPAVSADGFDQPLQQAGAVPQRLPITELPGTQDYRPSDLRALFNSLFAWGDLRILERQVEDCSLRLSLSGRWYFEDQDLAYLVRRIAAAEIEFFGTSPDPAILVQVAPNPVRAQDGFDYYGVHVGQSILLFLDPGTTFADLGERAASVVAHEMFHGWLGEAIRQEDLEVLWFTEGATTWYTARLLTETGIWSRERATEVVGRRIEQDYFANELLEAGESIATAATMIMCDAATTRFAYAGGCLAASTLDRVLAEESSDHPLDDVLRYLYAHHRGQTLTRELLEQAVLVTAGVDCSAWLDTYVYGNEPLPHPESLF